MPTIRQRRLPARTLKSSRTFRISGFHQNIEKVGCRVLQSPRQAQKSTIEMCKVQLQESSEKGQWSKVEVS